MPFGTLVHLDAMVLDWSSSRPSTRDHATRATKNLTETFDVIVGQEMDFTQTRNVLLVHNGLGSRLGKPNASHRSAYGSVHHLTLGISNWQNSKRKVRVESRNDTRTSLGFSPLSPMTYN